MGKLVPVFCFLFGGQGRDGYRSVEPCPFFILARQWEAYHESHFLCYSLVS